MLSLRLRITFRWARRERQMTNLIEYIQKNSPPLDPVPTGETFRIIDEKSPRRKPSAVLFDIYGTLFISASGDISLAENYDRKNDGLRQLVRRFKISIPGHELPALFTAQVKAEHERLRAEGVIFPEVRVEELWARILRKNLLSDSDFIESFALGYELTVNPVFPMPGLADLLSDIKEKGIPMGIISNAQFFTPLLFPAFLGRTLEELGFKKNLCFYSFEYAQAKPGNFLYEKSADALKKMGVSTGRCLYVGNDMRNDILPAHSLGYRTALFAGDKRSLRWRKEDAGCRDESPDYVLSSLANIRTLI